MTISFAHILFVARGCTPRPAPTTTTPEKHMEPSIADLIAANPTPYERRQQALRSVPEPQPRPQEEPPRQNPVSAALIRQASHVEKLKRIARHHASTAFAEVDRAYWQGRYEMAREIRDLLESAVCSDELPTNINGHNTYCKTG